MTRDQIAAMAMQGLLAGRPDDAQPARDRYGVVHEAVAYADALIAELARTAPAKTEAKKK